MVLIFLFKYRPTVLLLLYKNIVNIDDDNDEDGDECTMHSFICMLH